MKNKNVKMGLFALTLVTASNMMGSGVFMLPVNLAAVGWISVFGWVLTIIGVLALALVFAKSSMISSAKTGGIVAYAGESFGEFIGFQQTICYWISAWIGNVALLITGVGYLAYFFPDLRHPLMASAAAIIILWLFVLLSSCGAKTAGRAQSFTAICMLIVVLGTGILGWMWFKPETFFEVYNDTGASSFKAIITAASLALWGFLGVESAVVSSGQVNNPSYTVPRVTVLGLLIAAVCYVSSSAVIMGLVPHKILVNSTAPFADAAKAMFGETAGTIVSVLSIIACFGSISGWLILQSEAPRYGAKAGLLPSFFAKTNKNDVPMQSLIFTGVLMSLVILMTASPKLAEQFQIVILMSVFASLMPYMYAVISLPLMMINKGKNKGSEFVFYVVMVIIAMIYSMFALLGSGANSMFWGTLMMVLTIPPYCYVVWNKNRREKFSPNLKPKKR